MDWEATNWNGTCDNLAKIAKPTLAITGTDDNGYMAYAYSLSIDDKKSSTACSDQKLWIM